MSVIYEAKNENEEQFLEFLVPITSSKGGKMSMERMFEVGRCFS